MTHSAYYRLRCTLTWVKLSRITFTQSVRMSSCSSLLTVVFFPWLLPHIRNTVPLCTCICSKLRARGVDHYIETDWGPLGDILETKQWYTMRLYLCKGFPLYFFLEGGVVVMVLIYYYKISVSVSKTWLFVHWFSMKYINWMLTTTTCSQLSEGVKKYSDEFPISYRIHFTTCTSF